MRTNTSASAGPDRLKIRKMFDDIAGSYDLLNRIISFGTDNRWRRKGLSLFSPVNKLRLLDLGCGTGDLSRISHEYGFASVVGADFSMEMLLKGKPKNGRYPGIGLCNADAEALPFRDASFTACCIAFAVRNFQRRDRALAEICRVLGKGGELMIIEFSMPGNVIVRSIYNLYFFYILPVIGWIISGNYRAYRYLPRSVNSFPPVDEFSALIRAGGFSTVDTMRLSLGIAHIYLARKE